MAQFTVAENSCPQIMSCVENQTLDSMNVNNAAIRINAITMVIFSSLSVCRIYVIFQFAFKHFEMVSISELQAGDLVVKFAIL